MGIELPPSGASPEVIIDFPPVNALPVQAVRPGECRYGGGAKTHRAGP